MLRITRINKIVLKNKVIVFSSRICVWIVAKTSFRRKRISLKSVEKSYMNI
jgi:hypothetical protein